MAHHAFGGVLDTPRSNAGDATYLSRLPDISDISPEASFIAPDKDDDLLQRLRNGKRSNFRTPRRKGPLVDRPNLPTNIGGGEFTPMLKSATLNSTRRNGKENNTAASTTPAALRTIDEDEMTPLPRMDFSVASYLETPQIASSISSTPIGPPPRRNGDMGPLQDGKQLSLREQENVIDKIEKENFGLKLKIQFLNDALMKSGPGYNEAALKENTELKVEKVTMQRELQRLKKQITTVERDLEKSRHRGLELEESAKKKHANSRDAQTEMDTLRQNLQDRETDIEELQRQISEGQDQDDRVEILQDEIEDLKAEIREKEVIITDQEERLDTLQQTLQDFESEMDKLQNQVSHGEDGEERIKELQDNNEELQAELQARETNINELEAKIEDFEAELQNRDANITELEGTIEELETKLIEKQTLLRKRQEDVDTLQQNLQAVESERDELQLQVSQGRGHEGQVQSLQFDNKQLKTELREKQRIIQDQENKLYDLEETKRKLHSALSQKEKAEMVLDEFEEERANTSFVPKGLSRQREQRIAQLQAQFAALEKKAAKLAMDNNNLQATVQEYAAIEQEAATLLTEIEKLQAANDNLQAVNKDLQATNNNLQNTNDNLQTTNDNLRANNSNLQATVQELRQKHSGFEQNGFGQIGFGQNAFGQKNGFGQNAFGRSGFGQSGFGRSSFGVFGQGQQDFERQKLEAEVYSLEKMLSEEKKKGLDHQKLEAEVHSLEKMLAEEKKKSGETEEEIRAQYEDEIQRLDDEISNHQAEISDLKTEISNLEAEVSDLRAVIREKDSLYDNDSTEWETEKRMLQSRREQAEQRAAGLQRTVDRLRQAEGSLSSKETKLQEVMQSEADRHRSEEGVLNRQIDSLQEALETRQGLLTQIRSELSTVRDELRQTKIDYQAQVNRVEELEIRGAAENKASQTIKQLQQKLIDIEDEKSAMEELLEKAEEDAEEMSAQHELAMQRVVQKLEKVKRERDAATASRTETNKQSQQLRVSQAELESLEHDVLQQEKLIENLVASEAALRLKLERTRSERAAYRVSAEKLQKDLQLLKKEAQEVQRQRHHRGSADEVLNTIVRAAENTEAQHRQKSSDMMLQMEFMHARWEREAALRKDVSYAKKFVQLQLDVAMACNKAQVRELQKARAYVLQSRHPVSIPELPSPTQSPTTLKAFLVMARFIARMRIAARKWAPQEDARKQLRLDIREKRRDKRMKLLSAIPVEALY
ncbi:uncharacterized protein Triagg1_7372 [Trichoderma aggressivum f. europaeum]|uniref:Pericentrin/AKAP-450 centrosomal targeting domain-containing protein n=1 Tax=Trichoderma aggressivum f. europaeum TaxID=173218 RepID=A0AAE1J2J6_9HYPO|nr:hypothetical protein Triagg1_7372 [Trichoderma aggressivum f. europaeum]